MAVEEGQGGDVSGLLPLTDYCHHWEDKSEVIWDLKKYWEQRHSIWSRYDEGIQMTDDAWFGVTPEPIATQVAHDIGSSTSAHKKTIIDIFAGAGGNAIAFALSGRWETIIAIEKDPSVIACAQYNASIYGVVDQITWVNGDSFECLPLLLSSSSDSTLSSIPYVNPAWSTADPQKADVATTVIFASPPWGGPGYSTEKIFDLSTMQPYSLHQIYDVCTGMDCALFLPRTSDLRQIARLVKDDERKIEVVQYCMEGASKALVAYIPAAIQEA